MSICLPCVCVLSAVVNVRVCVFFIHTTYVSVNNNVKYNSVRGCECWCMACQWRTVSCLIRGSLASVLRINVLSQLLWRFFEWLPSLHNGIRCLAIYTDWLIPSDRWLWPQQHQVVSDSSSNSGLWMLDDGVQHVAAYTRRRCCSRNKGHIYVGIFENACADAGVGKLGGRLVLPVIDSWNRKVVRETGATNSFNTST